MDNHRSEWPVVVHNWLAQEALTHNQKVWELSIVFTADLQAGAAHKRYSSFDENTCVLCKCMYTNTSSYPMVVHVRGLNYKNGEKSKKGNGSKMECWNALAIHSFLRDNAIHSQFSSQEDDWTRHATFTGKKNIMWINLVGCWRKYRISNRKPVCETNWLYF